jgi:hypothetical protein
MSELRTGVYYERATDRVGGWDARTVARILNDRDDDVGFIDNIGAIYDPTTGQYAYSLDQYEEQRAAYWQQRARDHLFSMGAMVGPYPEYKGKPRGRPKGSKNKPKKPPPEQWDMNETY